LLRSSIYNLIRLGLLEARYDCAYKKTDTYEKFKQHPEFLSLAQDYAPNNPEATAIIKPGIIQITPFGINFLTTCL